MKPLILALIAPLFALLALSASAGNTSDVTYTISAEEASNGPKPADPDYVFESSNHEAGITVDAGEIRAHINPLTFGAAFEDLNHEIYGGLYAQMIFGESFEEGPEKNLPPGWRTYTDWLDNPTWQGMWYSENGAMGMTGFRDNKLFWTNAVFGDGTIQCDLMQPAYDPGNPIGLVFRAGGQEFGDAYSVMLDAQSHRLELHGGARNLASAVVPTGLGEWLPLRIKVSGGQIRVFAGQDEKPLIDFTDPQPLTSGLVGFDTSGSHGWFRNLRFETDGKTYTPPLMPVHPAGYRGPVSQWWDPLVTGGADAVFSWDADRPFNSLRSQKIEIRSGHGTAGVVNRGLHRFGLAVLKGCAYQGRLYLRGDYSGHVTVALQSADGAKTYAVKTIDGVGTDWKKFSFRFTADTTDHDARFAVWIDRPGAVWVDQVVLMPTGDGLFKGLSVRADIAKAVLGAGITCIRMGGDFSMVPGYRWKTMLDDPDQRPQYNSCWYPFETRGWGIVEFLAFCQAADIEAIPCINSDETPGDWADFVEFCNGPANSRWGRERVKMGYPQPFDLKYLQIGNGYSGDDRMVTAAKAIHAVDSGVRLLSGSIGHVDYVLPNSSRLLEMRRQLDRKVYAVAVYPYDSDVTGYAMWQKMLDRLEPLSGAIKIYCQEVNAGNHDLLRGLADAAFEITTERNADFVDIVTYCNMLAAAGTVDDNGWDQGRIFFNNHQVWLQPQAWTIRMAHDAYEPLAVETDVNALKITFKNPIPYGVPVVDALVAGAARNKSGDLLALKVVNFAPFALKTKINITGMGEVAPTAKIVLLTGRSLNEDNTAENPERIALMTGQISDAGSGFQHVFPAYSYTIIQLKKLKTQP